MFFSKLFFFFSLVVCFVEELHLQPTKNVLVSLFNFTLTLNNAKPHYQHFPPALAYILSHFNVDSFELSFTQGRWSSDWKPLVQTNPTGVHIIADMAGCFMFND